MKKLLLIITLIISIPVFYTAQELEAKVTINFEQLPNKYKEKLSNFSNELEDYLNNNQYSGSAWEWPRIKCNFNIFFTASGGETNYSAQVVVTSQRPIEGQKRSTLMMSVMDNSWSFNYEKGQSMYFNQTDFDVLTSFLDYYAYIIIGLDADSYEPFSGSDFFREALKIAVLGSSSSNSSGWVRKSTTYNKRALVEDLMDAKYQQFRKDFTDYHYNGLDLYYQNKNKTFENMVKLINNLKELRKKMNRQSVLINVFFEAKSKEIIEYLKAYKDKSIFEALQIVDSPRISKYIEAMEE